jgi:putative phosphoesterase
MLVGLLGDTHDRLPAITELVRRMVDAGAGMILHVGDYSSPFSLAPIHDANIPLAGVFGRNDGDREGLRAYAAKGVGTELYESPHSVEVGGQRILLVHDVGEVGRLSVHAHAIIVHGCSHVQEMKTRGDALMINPGEGCGWLFGAPSAALLDLDTKRVEFIKLDSADWTR